MGELVKVNNLGRFLAVRIFLMHTIYTDLTTLGRGTWYQVRIFSQQYLMVSVWPFIDWHNRQVVRGGKKSGFIIFIRTILSENRWLFLSQLLLFF